jgi:hypothetical protein
MEDGVEDEFAKYGNFFEEYDQDWTKHMWTIIVFSKDINRTQVNSIYRIFIVDISHESNVYQFSNVLWKEECEWMKS